MKSIIFYLSTLIAILNAATLQDSCLKTPFWKLNICQIDCQKCGAKASCQLCPDKFNLTKTKCVEDSSTIYRYSYFAAPEQTSKSISQYNFKRSNQLFKVSDIVTICQTGLYKFDMMGLFNQQDRMTFNLNFDSPVTAVTFKFNFFSMYQNTKVQLVMNGNLIYQTSITGSNVNAIYEKYHDQQPHNYLSVPSLTEGSAAVLIRKFNTGSIAFDYDLAKNNVYLQIQVSLTNDPKNTNDFWGFSDFSVVAQRCQDCLPQRLKTLSTNVGIAIGVNFGVLLVLVLILFACVKIGEKKRLRSLQEDESQYNLSKQQEKMEEKDEEKEDKLNLRETVQTVEQKVQGAKKNKHN